MKVPDLFVGKRLFVGDGNPVGLGVGPTEIRGSAYIEGPLMLGNFATFPTAEANLMVARCINAEALPLPPSIFKVSSRLSPPTPIDVVLGDVLGPVGINVNSTVITIVNATRIDINSPFTNGVGVLNWNGAKTLTGVVAETGAEARAGAEAVSGATVDNGEKNVHGPLEVGGTVTAVDFYSTVTTLNETYAIAVKKKDFDIPHPTKKGWRLRHVCIEGPTADVYIRGKLIDSNTIQLPEYWRNLVDPETITINITPIGSYQELFVEKIEWGSRVIIKNNAGSSINCYYTISAERIDVEKNIPEYEGNYEDYPGNNDEYMNGMKFLFRGN